MSSPPPAPAFFDPRWASLVKLGLYGSLASAAAFTVTGALAASISQPAGVFVFLAAALPACAYYGIKARAPTPLAAFCCCSGVLAVLFVIGCLAQLQLEKPTLLCVCDPACTSLPALGPRGGGGGGGGDGGGGTPQDPAVLRNSSLYAGASGLCARQGAVLSSMNAYVVLGALGLVAQFAACGALCHVRNKWSLESALLASERLEAAIVSQWQAPRALLYNPHAAAAAPSASASSASSSQAATAAAPAAAAPSAEVRQP